MARFIKLPRNKRFNYTPRHYDEQKEKMERRIKRIKDELDFEQNKDKDPSFSSREASIRDEMRYSFNKNRKLRKRSNLTLILIFAGLMLIVYLIFFR